MSEYSEAMERATERKKDADRQAKNIRDESMGLAGQSRDTMVGLYGQTKTAADDTANTNYQNSLTSTNDTYDTSEEIIQRNAHDARTRQNQEADNAQAQNWMSYMKEKRNLPQELAAAGYTGGASETSLLSLKNAYANARGNTETTRMNANAATNLAEQNQMAQAESERRAQLTQLGNELRSTLMQNQRDYNNGVISAEQAYQSTVAGIYSVYQQAISANYSGWNSSMTSLDSAEIAYNKAQEAAAEKASSGGGSSYTPARTAYQAAQRTAQTVNTDSWVPIVRNSIDEGMSAGEIVSAMKANGLSEADTESVLRKAGLI